MAPSVQTAVVVYECGGPEVLRLVHDHPVPKRKPGEVLVHIKSTSVNPVDTAVRAGGGMAPKLPKVLGGDVAGVVEEADEGSTFKVGDPVFALTYGYWIEQQEGSYCQYGCVPEAWCARVPTSALPLSAAGAVPLVGLTAWQALMGAAPHLGQRALVLAASGGVGHLAVQLAKALGLYVVGVAGSDNVDFVKELGADEVVDYKKAKFAEAYKDDPFDIVIDCMGDKDCLKVLKPSGHLSHIMNKNTDQELLQQVEADHKAGKGPGLTTVLVKPNGHQLGEVAQLIEQGKVKPVVSKEFPLAEAADAHRQVETGHTRGKVVLAVPE
jgi:NADPH:quinone reductase-like Zn-dependent oxidoreductase